MNCKYCGNELHESDAFCTQCGAAVNESNSKRIWSAIGKAACYFIAFNLIQLITATVYTIAISFVGSFMVMSGFVAADDPLTYVTTLYYTYINELLIMTGILTIVALFLFFRIRHRRLTREIRLRPVSFGTIVLAVILGICAQYAINFTLSQISVYLPEWIITTLVDQNEIFSNGSFTVELLDVVIVTPIVEEIIFRGLIHTRLRSALPKAAAIAISSVIFGLAHGNVLGFIYAGALGVILALVFEKYDSIIPPMLIHAGFNGASYLLDLLPNNLLIILGIYFISIALMVAIIYYMIHKKAGTHNIEQEPRYTA